jgi:hypothetical protein
MIERTWRNVGNADTLENNTLKGHLLILFMLRNIKCESTVAIVMRTESNVLRCDGDTFCLIAVNIVEITFINWFYYFVRL